MKFSTGALAASTAINMAEQKRILNHIDNIKSEMGAKAKKEYKRFNLITLGIIFFVMIPIIIYTLLSFMNSIDNPKYPAGATKQIVGRISLYEDTFWYTDSSQKYEFNFDDYNIDDSYEPGESIYIYLDDFNNIVSVSHKTEDYGMAVNMILMFVIPVVLLFLHALIGRKTYAKNWSLYSQWYEKEIEPYRFQPDFDEIVATKQYYDVTVNLKDLNEDKQKLYKKYRNKNIVYSLLLFVCIILTIYFYIKFEIKANSWIGTGIIVIYVIIFYILIDSCDVEMHRIKSGYYDNK
ncbi:hypothetical protein ACQRBF_04475 [Peptoniphilaceae bacterium SGI.131]